MKVMQEETKEPERPRKIRVGEESARVDHLKLARDYLRIGIDSSADEHRHRGLDYWFRLAEIAAMISIAEGANYPRLMTMEKPVWTAGEQEQPAGRPGRVEWVPAELDENQFRDFQSALGLLKLAHFNYCEHAECSVCQQRRAAIRYLLEKYKPLL